MSIPDHMTLHQQYMATFDGPAGKAVLEDLMKRCGLLVPSYNSDPIRMAFNEGKRGIALYIYNMLDTQAAARALAEQGDKTK